ncbi:hypothetical protein M409DRAFT_29461 [Zasmidium cellare ATCC 36951]|uniref:Zn(2)-C6 fungal-type domain-containing protein n=1 Tax=Zasmidium cellare ATCC 36951 TaxID=1080233 RepID=A0A6A6BZK2_ZASCE|nr:uncharacterized protein M409DRAFT_29461 [Zasmidium cellare ATCC 36951]KAF2160165.1 hypothetical protein M409DRAFT_29461 [Zasmidium cellare ATCC 36951]
MEPPNASDTSSPPLAKKRRTPKACASCRRSKLRCDEQRPCSRCLSTGNTCVYFERPKDPTVERFERIESALSGIQDRLDIHYGQPSPVATHSSISFDDDSLSSTRAVISRPVPPSSLSDFALREPSTTDLISSGLCSEQDARLWFVTFFQGCDRFVPVFDPSTDTFESVKARSSILFDIIVSYGCRAATGVLSRQYQMLYSLLRRHTSDLILRLSASQDRPPPLEDIQALMTIASYSDSGAVLADVALKAAIYTGLANGLDSLFASVLNTTGPDVPAPPKPLREARVWYGLFVLDHILSLDGGKPSSVYIQSSPRRVRALVSHQERTSTDLRLFAQVELNAIRLTARSSLTGRHVTDAVSPDSISRIVNGTLLDLQLWLSEWQAIEFGDASSTAEHPVLLLNLRIQHAWAILTLQLWALTASGVENIALMTDSQRDIALAAKSAAEQHLQLLLTNVPMQDNTTSMPYVANLRYAMEFVWAKNAFCILIVLRLGILLGDPPNSLIQRLTEAHQFLHELDKAGMGANISYMRILAQTVDKCERAVKASMRNEERNSAESSDTDFQSFIPKEFMFEWDFPGLNLCYIPFDWQDLFLDFGTTA